VLCVAGDFIHKNLAALLDVWGAFGGERPLLAFVGPGTDAGALPARVRALGLDDDVRVLGTVPAVLLEDLYAAAGALALPTRFEGFGLPVLEAMARGVPVVCSDLPVLREIGADQVLYVDPDRPAEFAAAIRRALDGALDVTAARAQAASFTWAKTAAATAAAYETAMAARRS
jgi:glycosyltransferase involved in cell wall biosynthesis